MDNRDVYILCVCLWRRFASVTIADGLLVLLGGLIFCFVVQVDVFNMMFEKQMNDRKDVNTEDDV